MRHVTDILYGVSGQVLVNRAIEGQPSAATFKVFNDYSGDDTVALFSGTATIDPVSATLTAAAGVSQADPQRIPLTSTGIETGQKYLLTEGQLVEWIDPIEVESGYIRARHPMRNAYTTAATLKGTTMTAVVDDTWGAQKYNLSNHLDPNPDYRVRWEYVVGGVTHVAYTFFDLVRATVVHQVDIDDINARAPGLMDTLPTEYRQEQGRPLVEAAWRSVKADLGALGIDTDASRDDMVLDELVIAKALVVLAVGGWKPLAYPSITEYLTVVREDYSRFLEKNFAATESRRLGVGTDGGAAQAYPSAMWSK